MSCKIEYPLVSYPRIVFDTQVGEDGLHPRCYTSSCLRSIIVEYQYGQEASRQNIAMTHAS